VTELFACKPELPLGVCVPGRRASVAVPARLLGSLACHHHDAIELPYPLLLRKLVQVPLIVLAPQPHPTPDEPFYSEPPPYWSPSVVAPPEAINVPSAPPLPAELLQPGGSVGGSGVGRQAGGPRAVGGLAAGCM